MLARPVPRGILTSVGISGGAEYFIYFFIAIFVVVIIASIVYAAALHPQQFGNEIGGVGTSFNSIFIAIADGFKQIVTAFIDAIKNALINPVTSWFQGAGATLKHWWNGLVIQ